MNLRHGLVYAAAKVWHNGPDEETLDQAVNLAQLVRSAIKQARAGEALL